MMNLQVLNYSEFVLCNILRPYQRTLGWKKRIEDKDFIAAYDNIMQHAKNPEWVKLVFNRLSEIYKQIDVSFFPNDDVAAFIKEQLLANGVELTGITKGR